MYLILNVDYESIKYAFLSYSLIDIFVTFFIVVLLVLANTLRKKWSIAESPPFYVAYKAVLLSLVYNSVLPAKTGDVVSAVYLSNKLGKSKTETFYPLLLERFFDVNFIVLFSLLIVEIINKTLFYVMTASVLVSWIVMFLLVRYNFLSDFVLKFVKIQKLNKLLSGIIVEIRRVDRKRLGLVCLGSALSFLMTFGFFIYSYTMLARLGITFNEGLISGIVVTASSLIPTSPGSLGVFEVATVFALGLYDIDYSNALLIAVFSHIIFIFTPMVLLLFDRLITRRCFDVKKTSRTYIS